MIKLANFDQRRYLAGFKNETELLNNFKINFYSKMISELKLTQFIKDFPNNFLQICSNFPTSVTTCDNIYETLQFFPKGMKNTKESKIQCFPAFIHRQAILQPCLCHAYLIRFQSSNI
jgi:hypothetical protein